MILSMKRCSQPPKIFFRFPFYLRTGSDRYFFKVKSATEVTWLQYVRTEKCTSTESGWVRCDDGEFFDIQFMVNFFNPITEKDYLNRLRNIANEYEDIKQSLNL